MQNSITPERIANSILQDRDFEGFSVFVEGTKDIRLYRKFCSEADSKIKVTFGKKNMRETYEILMQRGFNKMIGIRDADFIRIAGVGKYDPNYNSNIFLTDSHDSEGMILNSTALSDFLSEIAREENIAAFTERFGCLRSYIYSLSYPIACLRLANKKHTLGLSFKPEKPEGNKLKFKKFICEKTLTYLGDEKLINTVIEYSKNRGSVIAKKEEILEKLLETMLHHHPKEELTNGHDISEILYIICKKGLLSTHDNLLGASSVEAMLRLAFSWANFEITELCRSLSEWQKMQGVVLFNPSTPASLQPK